MRPLTRLLTSLLILALPALAGCEQPAVDPAQEVQATLDELATQLTASMRVDDMDGLNAIATRATSLRTATPSQGAAKAMLASTARARMADLQYAELIVEASDRVMELSMAAGEAGEAALLRAAAASMSQASQPLGEDALSPMETAIERRSSTLDGLLAEADDRISALALASGDARDEAVNLRLQADDLLLAAREGGYIEGFRTFREGMRTIRDADGVDLGAASIELESELDAQRRAKDARAEIDGIRDLLDSIRNSMDLLGRLRRASRDGAASLRSLADEIDFSAANAMDAASERAAELAIRWQEAVDLLSAAIEDAARGAGQSREARSAAAAWSLDLQWTLGRVEEARAAFLRDRAIALQDMVDLGVVTASAKWSQLASVAVAAADTATDAAKAAYEEARTAAAQLGNRGEAIAATLQRRIDVLDGNALPPPPDDTSSAAGGTGIVDGPGTHDIPAGAGFATPEALVAAIVAIETTCTMPPLTSLVDARSDRNKQLIAAGQPMMQAAVLAYCLLEEKLGDDPDYHQAKEGMLGMFLELPLQVDPATVQQTGADTATVDDPSGYTTWNLVLVDGGWKVSEESFMGELVMDSDLSTEEMLTQATEATAMWTKLADALKGGQISTLQDLMGFMQQMAP